MPPGADTAPMPETAPDIAPVAWEAVSTKDGWLPYPPDPRDFVDGLRTVRTVATERRRDPGEITPALFATVFVDDDPERCRQALDRYCQATYGLPRETVGLIQAEIAAALARYAGVQHILFRIAALEPDVFADQLAALPAVIAHLAPERGAA
jgi:alkanesulfonate monooxygenase SsuD/methylene tetrahydromethanopterin reductase-like flavin-dependent oxidoreductase (luciferase family)